MPTTDGFDYSSIINAALALYGIQQGKKTPNFYPVPPTEAETWRNDQTKNLYGMASGFTDQYLKGLGNLNPDWQMPNNLTGNPAFMGGIKVPTIDFSKIPSSSGNSPIAPAPPTTPGATIGGPGGGDNGGGVFAPIGSPGDPFKDIPSSLLPPGTTPDQAGNYTQLWNWMQQHPNIAKGGADAIAAALGIIGGPIAGIIAMIGDKAFRMFVDHATPMLPIKPNTIPPADLTPAGYPKAPPPRENMNPPGLPDPWASPFMGSGGGSGGGLTDPPGGWRNSTINGPTQHGQYR